jgi:hypothetical protein
VLFGKFIFLNILLSHFSLFPTYFLTSLIFRNHSYINHVFNKIKIIWATSKGARYFYYEFTSVGHRGKEACYIRSISAKALEDVVLENINQISQSDILIQKILC